MSDLRWNVGDINGTTFLGILDYPAHLDDTAARLIDNGAVDDGPGDKTTYEFRGTFNGAVFTLYDYYGSPRLHIGGHRADDFSASMGWAPPLDVPGLMAYLTAVLSGGA